jgi:hypothetical protein
MEVYGHLTPGYLQAEVDRLQFGLSVPDAVAADEVAERQLVANAESAGNEVTERWLRPIARLPHDEQLTAVAERFDLGIKEDCG